MGTALVSSLAPQPSYSGGAVIRAHRRSDHAPKTFPDIVTAVSKYLGDIIKFGSSDPTNEQRERESVEYLLVGIGIEHRFVSPMLIQAALDWRELEGNP